MARSVYGLILVGGMLLFAAACGSPTAPVSASEVSDDSAVDTVLSEDEGTGSSEKPVVTVNLSPT